MYVEAAIDFPEEDVDFLADGAVGERLLAVARDLQGLLEASRQGVLLRDGITVAILGAPNVGKSSLLNSLAGEDRAIVTDVPGTTRDLVRVDLNLGGLPVAIVDTAGLRESLDPVEREGVRRARAQAGLADLLLLVSDLTSSGGAAALPEIEIEGAAVIEVLNKVDLTGLEPGLVVDELRGSAAPQPVAVRVSAVTHAGIGALRSEMMKAVGFADRPGMFTARQRHLAGLEEALTAVSRCVELLTSAAPGELVAEELRMAHQALGGIVGEMSADELLGEIFASFCIGK